MVDACMYPAAFSSTIIEKEKKTRAETEVEEKVVLSEDQSADTMTSASVTSVIDVAVVTMQLEVAKRICAKPNTKEYGIPSVVFQLYVTMRK